MLLTHDCGVGYVWCRATLLQRDDATQPSWYGGPGPQGAGSSWQGAHTSVGQGWAGGHGLARGHGLAGTRPSFRPHEYEEVDSAYGSSSWQAGAAPPAASSRVARSDRMLDQSGGRLGPSLVNKNDTCEEWDQDEWQCIEVEKMVPKEAQRLMHLLARWLGSIAHLRLLLHAHLGSTAHLFAR